MEVFIYVFERIFYFVSCMFFSQVSMLCYSVCTLLTTNDNPKYWHFPHSLHWLNAHAPMNARFDLDEIRYYNTHPFLFSRFSVKCLNCIGFYVPMFWMVWLHGVCTSFSHVLHAVILCFWMISISDGLWSGYVGSFVSVFLCVPFVFFCLELTRRLEYNVVGCSCSSTLYT